MRTLICLMAAMLGLAVAGAQTPAPAKGPAPVQKDSQVLQFEREQAAAKAAYKKQPKAAKAKELFVKTTVRLGTAYMTSAALDPKVKYRMALACYREALAIDPKNREAKHNKKMIEDIYTSMGRPIPQ